MRGTDTLPEMTTPSESCPPLLPAPEFPSVELLDRRIGLYTPHRIEYHRDAYTGEIGLRDAILVGLKARVNRDELIRGAVMTLAFGALHRIGRQSRLVSLLLKGFCGAQMTVLTATLLWNGAQALFGRADNAGLGDALAEVICMGGEALLGTGLSRLRSLAPEKGLAIFGLLTGQPVFAATVRPLPATPVLDANLLAVHLTESLSWVVQRHKAWFAHLLRTPDLGWKKTMVPSASLIELLDRAASPLPVSRQMALPEGRGILRLTGRFEVDPATGGWRLHLVPESIRIYSGGNYLREGADIKIPIDPGSGQLLCGKKGVSPLGESGRWIEVPCQARTVGYPDCWLPGSDFRKTYPNPPYTIYPFQPDRLATWAGLFTPSGPTESLFPHPPALLPRLFDTDSEASDFFTRNRLRPGWNRSANVATARLRLDIAPLLPWKTSNQTDYLDLVYYFYGEKDFTAVELRELTAASRTGRGDDMPASILTVMKGSGETPPRRLRPVLKLVP